MEKTEHFAPFGRVNFNWPGVAALVGTLYTASDEESGNFVFTGPGMTCAYTGTGEYTITLASPVRNVLAVIPWGEDAEGDLRFGLKEIVDERTLVFQQYDADTPVDQATVRCGFLLLVSSEDSASGASAVGVNL